MASFMRSQGHPINDEHTCSQPVAVIGEGERSLHSVSAVIFSFIKEFSSCIDAVQRTVVC